MSLRRPVARGITALAATGLAVAMIAPVVPAAAAFDTCGWTGNVTPLMAAADQKVPTLNLDRLVRQEFGARSTVSRVSALEVSLLSHDPGAAAPTDAAALIDNTVSYRVIVSTRGKDDRSASLQLLYRGLCYRSADLVPMPRVGSVGVETPAVSAKKALRLAQDYRLGHSDRFPPENPLIGLELMRATSAPPDFGKLRWFASYETAPGVRQVLAIHMNGKVKVVIP